MAANAPSRPHSDECRTRVVEELEKGDGRGRIRVETFKRKRDEEVAEEVVEDTVEEPLQDAPTAQQEESSGGIRNTRGRSEQQKRELAPGDDDDESLAAAARRATALKQKKDTQATSQKRDIDSVPRSL